MQYFIFNCTCDRETDRRTDGRTNWPDDRCSENAVAAVDKRWKERVADECCAKDLTRETQ